MDDIREKLVELICSGRMVREGIVELFADYLLANGVTVSEEALPVADEATERSVAVEKTEDQRKPEGFIGHRKLVQEWIPVSERLPERPWVPVLVHMPGEEPCPTVREGFLTSDGIWHSALYDREPDDVTHWMPLPAPPKKEE